MHTKTVYIVRHAQSTDNGSPVFQANDSPLSEKGKAQAESVARRVSQLKFDVLISSPYTRAQQTAQAIEQLTGKEIEYSDLFIERGKPASILGKSYDDEKANSTWEAWEKSLYDIGDRIEDGESFADITARADQALEFLSSRDETDLVVVTHSFFLGVMIARILIGEALTGEILRKFQRGSSIANTGLTVIKLHQDPEGKTAWQLSIYNDHAHLAD